MKRARWYVYELIDPRDGRPFYVGKGSGDRVSAHEGEARRQVCSEKCNRIRAIWSAELTVRRQIVAHFWDEAAAYRHEADRISWYGGLTNIAPGGGSVRAAVRAPVAVSPWAWVKGLQPRARGWFFAVLADWLRVTGGDCSVSVAVTDDREFVTVWRRLANEAWRFLIGAQIPAFWRAVSADPDGWRYAESALREC